MSETLWLLLATLLNFVGMAWLALAKDAHWGQVMPGPARKAGAARRRLRVLGSVGLALSLLACLQADPPSMAILEWVMLLAVGVTGVALALARRPRWLAPLWPFAPRSER